MLRNPGDPESAAGSLYSSGSAQSGGVGMERDNSMQGLLPDLEKLSLEKGRPLDVEDLDDAGWKVASKEGRIVELGSLGEGAGGAVTRCILKGGKTVFALKVCYDGISVPEDIQFTDIISTDHHNRPQPRC
jgi:mitogen-activated protein kinase kinase